MSEEKNQNIKSSTELDREFEEREIYSIDEEIFPPEEVKQENSVDDDKILKSEDFVKDILPLEERSNPNKTSNTKLNPETELLTKPDPDDFRKKEYEIFKKNTMRNKNQPL